MIKRITNTAILLGVLCSICISLWAKLSAPKIAYIKSAELVNEYIGMREAIEMFQNKQKEWKTNLITLQKELEKSIADYQRDSLNLSDEQRINRKVTILKLREDMIRYSNVVNEKAAEEDNKMTQGVLNQINSFVEKYSKQNGYSVIFGTTASGNLMYAEEYMDITDEVLDALNKDYKGQ